MSKQLNVSEFLQRSASTPIIDVRSPAEFAHGHIPTAQSLPIFDNDERAEVGTLYTQTGREEAIQRGFQAISKIFKETISDLEERPASGLIGLPTGYIDLDNRMWAIFLFSIVSLSPFPEPRGSLPMQVSASA